MIYEFSCELCRYEWEEQRKVDDRDKEAVCSECGGEGTRGVSQCTFHLKGSGWEKDGYSTSYLGNKWGMKPHKKGT